MSLPSMFLRRAPRALPSFTNTTPRLLKQRSVHSMPPLTNMEYFTEHGVPGLFSQKAFKTSWTEYQNVLVQNLNRLIAETEYENKTPLDIAVMTARQADLAATFNYASQAHNNHFFFETLSREKTEMPEGFLTFVPYSFASPEALKTELLTTALKMFGCGWVWLVLDQSKYLRILCTYNAGTPYGAAYRRQDTDMNTSQSLSGPTLQEMTAATRSASQGPVNNWAVPLLNINVWEHAWLEDFGINGKEKYLEAFWNAIDWHVVASRYPFRDNMASVRTPFSQ
ncbi:manganese and iron superoxide dismutase [Wilcoxina mikolae CBS 423.85]|nr:manganese and iron superoxide dismutase [Wilcoxina mikolae CBS 423.85]